MTVESDQDPDQRGSALVGSLDPDSHGKSCTVSEYALKPMRIYDTV
jgi:hypothetical protein